MEKQYFKEFKKEEFADFISTKEKIENMNYLKLVSEHVDKLFNSYSKNLLWLKFFSFLESKNLNNLVHYVRFLETFWRISHYITINKVNLKTVSFLELSGISPISFFIGLKSNLYIANWDFRYSIEPVRTGLHLFDFVISTEAIEHIKDVNEKNLYEVSTFIHSGIKNYIQEGFSLLKPGGIMFLTTPNPCSFYSISKIFNYEHPYVYDKHVREMPFKEIINLFKEVFTEQGFELLLYDTFNSYSFHIEEKLRIILSELGISTEYRGDTQFFILRKI